MKTIVLSTLHDPQGIFLPLVKRVKNYLAADFSGTIVAYTKVTSRKLLSVLKELGWQPIVGGKWGEARKKALGEGLKTGSQHFFFCDFDKILHWLFIAKDELKSILTFSFDEDFLLFGRDRKTMASYPDSWIKTEAITNHLVSQIIGFKVDVHAAVFLFNRAAAQVLSKKAREKNWGPCSEYPLLIYKAGLRVACREADGLSWEDPDRFGDEIKSAGGLKQWQKENYDTLQEWEKRIFSLNEQLSVIKRLGFF